MFNYLKLISIFIIFLSCSNPSSTNPEMVKLDFDNISDGLTIEKVIAKFENSGIINPERIEGEFAYYFSEDNIYKSIFDSKNTELEIKYHHYGNENILDTIFVNSDFFTLPKFEKQDPLTMEVYKFKFQNKEYLVLTSKAISASGSGVNLTYFTLFEHENLKVREVEFFNSRFGIIDFIGDYDMNKELDFLKFSRTTNDDYSVSVHTIGNVPSSASQNVLTKIKYLGEDKFELL